LLYPPTITNCDSVSMNSKGNSATVCKMDSRTKMGVTGLIQIFRSVGKDGLGMEECLVLKGAYCQGDTAVEATNRKRKEIN
jgi:hypothetical protein